MHDDAQIDAQMKILKSYRCPNEDFKIDFAAISTERH